MNDIDKSFLSWKHWNKRKDFKRAFAALARGNCLRKKSLPEEGSDYGGLTTKLKNTFPFKGAISFDKAPFIPIFIVGMPRSGTSLAEQIVSNHSQVSASGELSFIEDEVMSLESGVLSEDVILKIRSNYFKNVGVKEGYVTDKMPLNFRWVGFIKTCFPEAKIIHCQKEAVGVCWSIYRKNWTEDGMMFSYDLKELGKFFNHQVALMKFWKKTYPNDVFTLEYEALTRDVKGVVCKLFDYLEIEVEAKCFSPHLNTKKMDTASASQVRKPIYQSAQSSWVVYKEQLKPLLQEL